MLYKGFLCKEKTEDEIRQQGDTFDVGKPGLHIQFNFVFSDSFCSSRGSYHFNANGARG